VQPHNDSANTLYVSDSRKINEHGIVKLVSNPLYNFADDVSDQFKERIGQLTADMARKLDHNAAINALGGDVEKPFSSYREGDVLHIVYPMTVQQGDLVAGIITVLSSLIPTVVLHEGSAGWTEPEWTSESRSMLSGILTAIKEVPKSFSHATSPADLTRVSLWITAASSALSQPGGVKDAQGVVLPPAVAGGKSASKYMMKVMSTLRSSVTDESSTKAIDTLGALIKLWQKEQRSQALSIVKNCKISWSTVLFKGSPTSTIKGKKGRPDQTVVKSPSKPSKSPWLSPSERNHLSDLLKDKWSESDKIRDRFVKLLPQQQHARFDEFVKSVKLHYEELSNISNSIHAKIGKRKNWIERFCKEQNFKVKTKGNERETFVMSNHFYNQELSKFSNGVKKVFAPITYLKGHNLGDVDKTWETITKVKPGEKNRITAADFDKVRDGPCYYLWKDWADKFLPVFEELHEPIREENVPVDSNMFSKLLGLSSK
jgi:hypothetical protein